MAESTLDDWEPYKPPLQEDGEGTAEEYDEQFNLPRKPSVKNAVNEEDELALWQRWCQQQDQDARAELVQLYMSYAKTQAARLYARRSHDEFEFDEYLQFAMVGLMESVDRYQLGRGAQFKTFAMSRIHGAIINGLGHLSDKTQQHAMRRRLAAERVASLKTDKLTTAQNQNLLQELSEVGVGIALGMVLEGSGMLIDPEDSMPDNVYVQVEMRQVREQLWTMVKRLTDREREVVHLHYLQHKNFEEIAVELKLTKGRISQLHRQGIARLRELISKVEKCDVAF